MHRIPSSNSSKPVVLLMHDKEGSALDWVLNDPKQAPGFKLAAAGWDVWMGNSRGNDFSITHLDFLYTSGDFWNDHDWEEMGLYDLPAFINQILRTTGRDSIDGLIGNGMGSTQFLAAAALEPTYFSDTIKMHFALGPI